MTPAAVTTFPDTPTQADDGYVPIVVGSLVTVVVAACLIALIMCMRKAGFQGVAFGAGHPPDKKPTRSLRTSSSRTRILSTGDVLQDLDGEVLTDLDSLWEVASAKPSPSKGGIATSLDSLWDVASRPPLDHAEAFEAIGTPMAFEDNFKEIVVVANGGEENQDEDGRDSPIVVEAREAAKVAAAAASRAMSLGGSTAVLSPDTPATTTSPRGTTTGNLSALARARAAQTTRSPRTAAAPATTFHL